MAKKKYCKIGEEPQAYECTKNKCKWTGIDSDKIEAKSKTHIGFFELVCPNCGNEEFYGLLENPKSSNNDGN